jgi:periplasmic protein TonB
MLTPNRSCLSAWIAIAFATGCAAQSPVTEPPQPGSAPAPAIQVPANPRRPEIGEYVPVDELPEAIMKREPFYPDEAKAAALEGTVIVNALVVEDGSVEEARAIPSIAALEDAAVACVRQWRFKPAMSGGKPVAVWVAVPVRFFLK